jgi:lipid-A-disaccharide synthase
MQAIDILILSNGPGEVTTWVRPVVQALRQQLGDDRSMVRISIVLSPCPNASGFEAAIARNYPQVDRVQSAQHFWQFLLSGKTAENWDWRTRGVILFLGGDQLFPVLINRHLGYRTVVYAEWETRWHRSIDRFGVMKADLIDRVPAKYTNKLTVVGDLMAEASLGAGGWGLGTRDEEKGDKGKNDQLPTTNSPQTSELIGLLPGSKPAKLAQGVPLVLGIAEYIHKHRPQTKFVIPVAPTLDIETLADFANPEKNPVIQLVKGSTAELILQPTPSLPQATSFSLHPSKEVPMLKTPSGLCVELWTRSPAYDLLSQCCLCLTTVGANTAELGALAIPMIVLLPTQQLDAMRAWDGIPGLLANLPLVGTSMAKVINWLALRRLGLLAWPNIWAKSEVVPELVGKLQPQQVAEFALDFLQHPEKLEQMRSHLRSIRGEPGAAQKLATLGCEELER